MSGTTFADGQAGQTGENARAPTLEETMNAIRGMIREEIKIALGQNSEHGGDDYQFELDETQRNPEHEAIEALTQKMEKLQEMVKGKDQDFDFDNLGLYGISGLPPKFRMPDVPKFNGAGDPKLHLKQYITIMSATILNGEQKLGLFPLTLEGIASDWYHALPVTIKSDWKALNKAFRDQFSYNAALEVSLRDLEMTKQKDGESFSEFLARWRNKAALMPNKPSERDQVRIIARNVHANCVEKLQLMNPRNFVELYDDGLQVEEMEVEKTNHNSKARSSQPDFDRTAEANAIRIPQSSFIQSLKQRLLKPKPSQK